MKKIFIALAIIFVMIITAMAIVPYFFKDDIKEQIDSAINESVNASVYYDVDKFGLSFFKNFPNPTVSLGDFGIVGKDAFENDTLVSIKEFNTTIDLISLFGDQIQIAGIHLVEPKVNILVLQDGKANYDIAVAGEGGEEPVDEKSASELSVGIQSWTIQNASIVYDDKSLGFYTRLDRLNHQGSGDFTLDIFDINTHTDLFIDKLAFEGVNYVSKQQLNADVSLHMDLPNMTFTFRDNLLKVNDFPLAFDGFVSMPGEDMKMDITFGSPGADVKSLYSLIPAAYMEGYESVEANGEVSFEGFVKGTLNESSLPAFQLDLLTKNGSVHYPDLPEALKNINIDMLVNARQGDYSDMIIDIKNAHLEFGNNPFDLALKVKNLQNYDMEASLKAKLNLEELTSIFPMEKTKAKGTFNIDLNASGIYDSVRQVIPTLIGQMTMSDGYLSNEYLPEPLTNLSFRSEVQCKTGQMKDFLLAIEDFVVDMRNEEFKANLTFRDLTDYFWDLTANGGLDLAMISELYLVEGMKYEGYVSGTIRSVGRFSDVEAERYSKIKNEGSFNLSNFVLESDDLTKPFAISKANMSFNPSDLKLNSFEASMGSSDFSISGSLSNYLHYALEEGAVLKGGLSFKSNRLDVNELMTGEETDESDASTSTDSSEMEVIEVPTDIDLVFSSSIEELYYDNLILNNTQGKIIVKDGVVNMDGLRFDLFNGNISMDGTYDAREISQPKFDYTLNINDLSMPKAFTAFSTVQTFAPMMQNLNGDFSSSLNISGVLDGRMMPLMETLLGNGDIAIKQAQVKDSKFVNGLNSVSNIKLLEENMTLKDIFLSASIEKGQAVMQPFNVKFGENNALVSGSIGLDGSIDYSIKTDVESKQLGDAASSLLANYTGSNIDLSTLQMTFGITGTYSEPKFSLISVGSKNQNTQVKSAKQEVKKQVTKEVVKQKEELKKQATEESERLKEETSKEVEKKTEEVKEELQKEADKALKDASKDAKKAAEDLLNNFFKKKKKKDSTKN